MLLQALHERDALLGVHPRHAGLRVPSFTFREPRPPSRDHHPVHNAPIIREARRAIDETSDETKTATPLRFNWVQLQVTDYRNRPSGGSDTGLQITDYRFRFGGASWHRLQVTGFRLGRYCRLQITGSFFLQVRGKLRIVTGYRLQLSDFAQGQGKGRG